MFSSGGKQSKLVWSGQFTAPQGGGQNKDRQRAIIVSIDRKYWASHVECGEER